MIEQFLGRLFDARLDGALQSAADGMTLLVRARRPTTWDRLERRVVDGPMARELAPLSADTGSPQEALLAAAADHGAAAASLTGVAGAPELRWTCFVADARRAPAEPWLRLAGTFASARASFGTHGPALVIRVDGGAAPSLCRLLDDGDFVGPAEAAVFARGRRSGASLMAEAADAAAIEAARGDLDLLDRLLSLPEADRFDPSGWALRQSAPGAPNALLWRGRDEPCPIWLARRDAARLSRRIWRGHVSVLLPWLVERQAEFIARHGSRLSGQLQGRNGEVIDARDYEWAEIYTVLRQSAPLCAPAANALRYVRNELAHGRPVTWTHAARLETHFQRLINGMR